MKRKGIIFAGQSNCQGYGEGAWDNETYPKIFPNNPHLLQMARATEVTPGGVPCAPGDLIPLTHNPHNPQYITQKNNPAVGAAPLCYGTVSFQYHTLATLNKNYGWQNLVAIPCARAGAYFGGADSAYTPNNYTETGSGMLSWSVTKGTNTRGSDTTLSALYLDMLDRTIAFLEMDPEHEITALVWLQGESDMGSSGNTNNHRSEFDALITKFREDLRVALGKRYVEFPIIVCDSCYYWKNQNRYANVWATYQSTRMDNLHFLEIPNKGITSNDPNEDLDEDGYYGSGYRDSTNWLSSTRASHFSSRANVEVVGPMIGAKIYEIATIQGCTFIKNDETFGSEILTKNDIISALDYPLKKGTFLQRQTNGNLAPFFFPGNSNAMYIIAEDVPAGTTNIKVIYHGVINKKNLHFVGGHWEMLNGTLTPLEKILTWSKITPV